MFGAKEHKKMLRTLRCSNLTDHLQAFEMNLTDCETLGGDRKKKYFLITALMKLTVTNIVFLETLSLAETLNPNGSFQNDCRS